MTEEKPPMLTRQAVAEILGVQPKSISVYLDESKTTPRKDGSKRKYADHPFPKPDGRIGSGPWWRLEREQDIRDWAAARVGRGVGGGRPRKSDS